MMLPEPTVPAWAATAVAATTVLAVDADFRSRTIPNRLTLTALLAALVCHSLTGGPQGFAAAASGALAGGGILLVGWLLGWMGAGDVKLMAAVGAWLGWPASLTATLAALLAGGVIALMVAARHGALGRSVHGAAMMGMRVALSQDRGSPAVGASELRFPFAAAILAGALISLWARL